LDAATFIVTVEPLAAVVPAAGSVEITSPSGTCVSHVDELFVTNPAFCRVVVASLVGFPVTSGTAI
jgi:hypothetical protein